MEMFVAAYLIVWLAVACYVARLGWHQRRLAAQVRAQLLNDTTEFSWDGQPLPAWTEGGCETPAEAVSSGIRQ
jgi:CcmD family protein